MCCRELDLDRRSRSIDGLMSQVSEAKQKAMVLAAEKFALEHSLKMLEGSLANEKTKRERLGADRSTHLNECDF